MELYRLRNKTSGQIRWAACRANIVGITGCAIQTSFPLVRALVSGMKKIVETKGWLVELVEIDEDSIREKELRK